MTNRLKGVIAAITTPIGQTGDPDTGAFVSAAQYLLENGCNGLNVLGTTGEATSFSVNQRLSVMQAASAGLPVNTLMVGVGAASVTDAVTLAKGAQDCGFGGALVLPPFYYKGVTDQGIVRYFAEVTAATEKSDMPLYLYNFPALSGIKYTNVLISALVAEFGDRIAGLKDSSGDLEYSKTQAERKSFDVFPSNEAVLRDARNGDFAGCISATANVNSEFCRAAFIDGDMDAQQKANEIRAVFSRYELVPAIKTVVAHIHGDTQLADLKPPLCRLSNVDADDLVAAFQALVS